MQPPAASAASPPDRFLFHSPSSSSPPPASAEPDLAGSRLSLYGVETELVPVMADDPLEHQPADDADTSPPVTQEQVMRQLQKLLLDGRELSRLLRKGTWRWWKGRKNLERRQQAQMRLRSINAGVQDILAGNTSLGDATQRVAANGLLAMEETLAPIFNNPAEFTISTLTAIHTQTSAAFAGLQTVLSGEHGSQAMPFRHLVSDGSDDSGELLVDVDSNHEEKAELLEAGAGEWEVI